MQQTNTNQSGLTLTTLLIFVGFTLIVATTSVALIISSTQTTTTLSKGESAYLVAESGVENAILRVLRDRSYSGETLAVGNGTAEVTVSGSTLIDITSIGTVENHTRTIHAQTQFNQGILEVITWDEQ